MLDLKAFLNSYLHNGEESVKQIDRLDKSLGAVAKETGQAPQFFHSTVSAFCRHSAGILKNPPVDISLLHSSQKCKTGSVGYLRGGQLHQFQASFSGKKVVLFRTAWLQLFQEQAVNDWETPHPGKHGSMRIWTTALDKLRGRGLINIVSLQDHTYLVSGITGRLLPPPTAATHRPTAPQPKRLQICPPVY